MQKLHPPTDLRRAWWILAVLALPVFIGALDLTIVSAILPEVMNQLNLPPDTRFDEASWVISAYLLAYTISMTFTGRLSDMLGRKWVYILCLLIFMFGSWFITIADKWPADTYLEVYRWFYPNPDTHIPPSLEMRQLYMIILGRVIQALGAGAMVPVTMALVGDLFPKDGRARPLGAIGAIDTAGWVLGHLYGGAMVNFFGTHGDSIVDAFAGVGLKINHPDWHTLFILNIPLSIIALIGAWVALRGPQFNRRVAGKFDFVGTGLITAALIGLSVGLGGASPESAASADSFDQIAGKSTDVTTPMLIMAAVAFAAFLFWEFRTKAPLIDLRLFRKANFSVAAFTNFCVGFALAIGLVSVPLLVNIRLDSASNSAFHDAALVAGLVLSGLTIPMALAAFPGGWLSDRYGYRRVTVIGMALSIAGFLLCSFTWTGNISFWIMAAEIALVGIGLGLTISPVATALMNDAPDDDRGVSSALVLVLRLVGMTLAISGLTTFALYRVDERVAHMPGLDRQDAYFNATVDQINEMFLIGAAVSLLALLFALRLHGGRVDPKSSAMPAKTTSEMRPIREIGS
ncbi:MAG: MFS transporter [Chloroflexi bacterium]|nr:MFS transporter [Chloroflexota bacterium]